MGGEGIHQHGGYGLLLESQRISKDALWLTWPSDTIQRKQWAHVVNVHQWKSNATRFSLYWDRGAAWVARGGYADCCAFQGFQLPLTAEIYERQHNAMTLRQNKANGSYGYYFQKVPLEDKQANTPRSSPLNWVWTKPGSEHLVSGMEDGHP